MLINNLNEQIKEKIYKEVSEKQQKKENNNLKKEIQNFNKKIKSLKNKNFVKDFIKLTLNHTSYYKEIFYQINNGVLDIDFLIEEMIKNGKSGLNSINLILNYSDGIQIKEESIKKILKKTQKSDKYLSQDSIIYTILKNQKNLDFLINEESIFFFYFNSLSFLLKNEELSDELSLKVLEKIDDYNSKNFQDNKKYLYNYFSLNHKIKKEYFEKGSYFDNNLIDIKYVLSNKRLDSDLIEYLLQKEIIKKDDIRNYLNNANNSLSKEFIKKYKEILSNNLSIRNLNSEDTLEYIKYMKKSGVNFKNNQVYLRDILTKKNYDYNFYKDLFGSDSLFYFNKETKEFQFELLDKEFKHFQNFNDLYEKFKKNDISEIFSLNNKIKHLITEVNIPEKYIIKYKFLFEYVNKMNTNDFKESDKSLFFLAENQYLPRNLYNENFINECISNKDIGLLSKQIKTFKDYENIKSKNLKIEDYREFVFLVSKNYIFLDNINKKEYQSYLKDLLNLEYPIQINEEMAEDLNNFFIYKENKQEIKLDYYLRI